MEEKKKKTLYIGIIIFCVGVTVFFIFFMNGSSGGGDGVTVTEFPIHNSPTGVTVPNTNAAPVPTSIASDSVETSFNAPQVFPADNKFHGAILDSSKIQSLNDYNALTVTPEEQGRDNPFAKF